MGSAAAWHFAIAGYALGPFSFQQLLALRRSKQLPADCLVHLQGWPDWRRLDEVPELHPAFVTRRRRVRRSSKRLGGGPRVLRLGDEDMGGGRSRPVARPTVPDMGADPFTQFEVDEDALTQYAVRPAAPFDPIDSACWDLDAPPALAPLAASSRAAMPPRSSAGTNEEPAHSQHSAPPARAAAPLRTRWRMRARRRWAGLSVYVGALLDRARSATAAARERLRSVAMPPSSRMAMMLLGGMLATSLSFLSWGQLRSARPHSQPVRSLPPSAVPAGDAAALFCMTPPSMPEARPVAVSSPPLEAHLPPLAPLAPIEASPPDVVPLLQRRGANRLPSSRRTAPIP